MELNISFPDTDTSEANKLASDLQNEIEELGTPVELKRVRDPTDTLDFGATLAIVLAAPTVTALAKGIAAWMKRTGTSVTLKVGDKDVVVKNVDSESLPGVMAAICAGAPPAQQ